MTDLRTAAQQALWALEGWDNYGKWVWPESALEQAKRNTTEALAALRAALAQEQVEQTWVCPDSAEHRYKKPGHCEDCGKTLVLAQAEPNVEYERGFIDGMQKQAQSSVDRAVNRMAQAEPFTPDAIAHTQTAWKMGYEARKAEQAEPDAAYQQWLQESHAPALRRTDSQGAFAAGWRAALAQEQAEPVQEPVYWEVRCTAHPKWMRVDEQQFDEYVAHGWEGQKLYTAPPKAEPLTDEEIDRIWRDGGWAGRPSIGLIRAIERALEEKNRA